MSKAVQNGKYHCVAVPGSLIYAKLIKSSHENFRVIAADLRLDNLSHTDIFQDLFPQGIEENIAFLLDTKTTDLLSVGKKFVSQVIFLENMTVM